MEFTFVYSVTLTVKKPTSFEQSTVTRYYKELRYVKESSQIARCPKSVHNCVVWSGTFTHRTWSRLPLRRPVCVVSLRSILDTRVYVATINMKNQRDARSGNSRCFYSVLCSGQLIDNMRIDHFVATAHAIYLIHRCSIICWGLLRIADGVYEKKWTLPARRALQHLTIGCNFSARFWSSSQ